MNRFNTQVNRDMQTEGKDGGSLLVKNAQSSRHFLLNSLHGEPFIGSETIYGSFRYLEKLDTESKQVMFIPPFKPSAEVKSLVKILKIPFVNPPPVEDTTESLVATIVAKTKAELRIEKEMLEINKKLASIKAKANEQRKRSALDVKKMRGERTKKNHFNNKIKPLKKFKPLRTSPLGYEKKYKKCCRSKGVTKDLRRAVSP